MQANTTADTRNKSPDEQKTGKVAGVAALAGVVACGAVAVAAAGVVADRLALRPLAHRVKAVVAEAGLP